MLSDLTESSWVALSNLENLDLSNNRLREIGDVVLMTWLRRLNLENNEINPIPLELGLCTGKVVEEGLVVSSIFLVCVRRAARGSFVSAYLHSDALLRGFPLSFFFAVYFCFFFSFCI